ncbi:MAG: DUF262 domain-containing protein [Porphyromonadaceae bacterium]|nr:DUF262 domain-containing protein [Porphyromonadaceae bacterium]
MNKKRREIDRLTILAGAGKTLFSEAGVRYVIPRYQRAYAWEEKEIEQLIDDICDDNDPKRDYYIGSLIVARRKADDGVEYEVIDGQQRLTTIYLLLQCLLDEGYFSRGEVSVGEALSFDCRSKSNYTLAYIRGDAQKSEGKEELLDQSILLAVDIIKKKLAREFGDRVEDQKKFVDRLKHVVLYRIEVPEHTDLNRYFEIMNTRGEQLEQHDILKARLMNYLDDVCEREAFARIWEACSDMTGYVQMHFSVEDRVKLFGQCWSDPPSENALRELCKGKRRSEGKPDGLDISKIIDPKSEVDDVDGALEERDAEVRFESIIDFPYFLLHVLRVFCRAERLSMDGAEELGSLLDDKLLLKDFDKVIASCEKRGDKRDVKRWFACTFIQRLLRSRFLFDKFIIKREHVEGDQEGSWSLKELRVYKKGPRYVNTEFGYYRERGKEQKSLERNRECLMIQSALRVSYTSPKVMHWITRLLVWLLKNESECAKLTSKAERIAAEAVAEGFFEKALEEMRAYDLRKYKSENYAFGVRTPHIVFNYLDYLLWKKAKKTHKDFVFEFRNSVEHWYPQHPSDGTIDVWDGRDVFGNLCIISRSVNSKFSNLSPESKMKSFERMVQRGSLKLRIMGEIISKSTNQEWIEKKCREHEKEMIRLLCRALQEAVEEE